MNKRNEGLDFKITDAVYSYVLGTCKSESEILYYLEDIGLTEENFLDYILEANIENCSCCGWWVEASEMELTEYHELVCSDCYEGGEDNE